MSSYGRRGVESVIITSVFTALAVIAVTLRIYTRLLIVRCVGLDDYCIVLSMFFCIGLTVTIGMQVRYGMGMHINTLSQENMENSLKAFWASLTVYNLSLGLTKTSILLQYQRVFFTKTFQIVCWITMAVVGVYSVWTVFGNMFACVPIRAFWTHETPARCISLFPMWFTNAALNIVTDLAIIILPMPVIRSLNLARRQKQALIGIFAVGGFVCVVSIIRIHSLAVISNSFDPTYDNPSAATWSSLETSIGIICSCLPCLRPLMVIWLPKIFPKSARSGPGTPFYNRNSYGNHLSATETQPSPIEVKNSRSSDDREGPNNRIQIVTEVHMQVDKDNARYLGTRGTEMSHRAERHSSTETLIREDRQCVQLERTAI
ncbi:hypothetical protein B0J11DRAFT_425457 [Dendryphion nanum]|uniref:Rhodopsin domain-containing protein n=1 Tax=Dendryphion nanum TaxID=256645 RepID=A0A9P9EF59_9PLEO|nr:hypothetical protein B0J11DRAFT_425457 [Dendryphion nanum]